MFCRNFVPITTDIIFLISLVSCHENVSSLNSLIFCHEFVKEKMPLFATYNPCYYYSQGPRNSPYLITKPLTRMYTRSRAKGPRPATSRSHTTYHHRSSTSMSSSTGVRQRSQPAHVNPKITPQGKLKLVEELRERTYKDSVCTMCSDTSKTVRHHHFSSSSIRRMFLNHGKEVDKTYLCPICKTLEPVVIPPTETRRIVMASSTLYGVWDHPMPSDTEHFDIDSIVGGKVRDMTIALQKNYLHMPNRLEIIVVAGINNIGAGDTAEEIIAEMNELRQVVKDHSLKWNHAIPSYVVFSTIILAPKFCSLYVPPSPPEPEIAEWVPAPSFSNKYGEVKKLNDLIIRQNKEEGQSLQLVRLDYQGVKRFKSGTIQHKFDNKPGATKVWRELSVFKKLHFTMENKLRIIGYISSCFRGNCKQKESQSAGHD